MRRWLVSTSYVPEGAGRGGSLQDQTAQGMSSHHGMPAENASTKKSNISVLRMAAWMSSF